MWCVICSPACRTEEDLAMPRECNECLFLLEHQSLYFFPVIHFRHDIFFILEDENGNIVLLNIGKYLGKGFIVYFPPVDAEVHGMCTCWTIYSFKSPIYYKLNFLRYEVSPFLDVSGCKGLCRSTSAFLCQVCCSGKTGQKRLIIPPRLFLMLTPCIICSFTLSVKKRVNVSL